ncbi:MAG: hypothetical protein WBN48_05310, partial [Thiogranum sp.]
TLISTSTAALVARNNKIRIMVLYLYSSRSQLCLMHFCQFENSKQFYTTLVRIIALLSQDLGIMDHWTGQSRFPVTRWHSLK